ncbi:exosortase/archaeosortase family protein [Geodermatophilus amargosae]|uniref:Exosortase/archaeosortase family protein n=1 Tax=Geodermatophilus amargosae TaxID=1296565 RepID=A0A1I6XDJ0_9ACTN|nr:exosortase/archaeosortase family protein [Geodermatophilus amargosae]SFT36171.1 exosortase/archaeosortase family protein [Geodermatophilus amargosae]
MTTAPAVGRRRLSRGTTQRLLPVVLDLALVGVICIVGFATLSGPLQVLDARGVALVLGWIDPAWSSGVLPGHILLFRGDDEIIDAVVTASCSSILSVLGLVALTAVILRGRKLHALGGLAVAIVAVVVLNHGRLLLSALAGLHWGEGALVLFHDWVGTVWNLVATLLGFLVMVWITLPAAERAEQDVEGRHTARRPDSWARPGLGYRTVAAEETGLRRRRTTVTGLLHRHVLPRRLSAWLAARREAARVDYRLGHVPAYRRVERVRELAADGLGAHSASLVAVATYETDPVVLDALADAVAARQWEPVTDHRVTALRLWARGWLLARPTAGTSSPVPDSAAVDDGAPVAVARIPVPPATPAAGTTPPPPDRRPHAAGSPGPASFARPSTPPHPPETPR